MPPSNSPPAQRAAAGNASSTSRAITVDVLTTHELWDAVTAFMAGYPLAVATLLRDSAPYTKLVNVESAGARVAPTSVLKLTGVGLLPHLAIAANDAAMLRTLFQLATHPQYAHDRHLSFQKAMRCAVLLNSVEMLQCLEALKHSDDPATPWSWQANEPNLMRFALQHMDVDTRVLDWLLVRLPPHRRSLFAKSMRCHASYGNLATVVWLHAHGCRIQQKAIDAAARHDQVDVLAYFYTHSRRRCQGRVLLYAAENGYAAVVELAVQHQRTPVAIDSVLTAAASNGHLPVVQFVVETTVGRLHAPYVMNFAAWNGHLDVVRYLHEHVPDSCTEYAMTDAAASGHLAVVLFLHENRTEGCAANTLDETVRNGHVAVVRYLRSHYPHLRCSASALEQAAARGDFDMVTFLLYSFGGQLDGIGDAIQAAVGSGHSNIVAFLAECCSDQQVLEVLQQAARRGHVDVVSALHARMSASHGMTVVVLEAASRQQQRHVVRFLCENQSRDATGGLLELAVASGDSKVVAAVQRFSSLEQVVDARELALKQSCRPMVVAVLSRAIDGRQRQREATRAHEDGP